MVVECYNDRSFLHVVWPTDEKDSSDLEIEEVRLVIGLSINSSLLISLLS